MKKLLFFAFALMALTITFTSCSDDDEKTPDSLVGTTWVLTLLDETTTFSFTTSTAFTISYSDEDDVDAGTYSYSKPNITINILGGSPLTGTVDGNKMTFTEGSLTFVFVRK
jgi:hypothetical protein